MNNIDKINNIKNNSLVEENTFLFFLSEGTFNKNLYNKLIFEIEELNKSSINSIERNIISIDIWIIAFKMSTFVCADINPNDIYSFDGLSSEEKIEINNIMFYVANFFTYGKAIDLSFALAK